MYPGFRTGCKIVCLDRQGKLEYNKTIFPTGSEKQKDDAANEIEALCEKYKIQVIAIGNGTAGRETEAFAREIGLPSHIQIEMVNESGASVYSASEVARKEFPDHSLISGGGVKYVFHLEQLITNGADGVLIASSLHMGWISGRDIMKIIKNFV